MRPYIWHAECLKNCYNAVDRTFYDAIKYWPGDTLSDHLEFALKYDGTNLAILASLFQEIADEDFLEYVRSKPTGKYARRAVDFLLSLKM